MNELVEKTKNNIESYLTEDLEHQNKIVDYILFNPKTNETITIASDGNEEIIIFAPHTKDYKNGYDNIPEWDYNFDSYLYEYLEYGYEIGFMSMNTHYGAWNSLNELFPTDVDNYDGIRAYLKYCKEKNITKELIDKETGLDTPDIMDFYLEYTLFYHEEYNNYIIEIDDTNADNVRESIVNIYTKNEDGTLGEHIDTISLNNNGIMKSAQEYVDNNYILKNTVIVDGKEVKMTKDHYDLINEQSYFTFVLGYDLLSKMIKKYDTPECDTNYDFCNRVASKFLNSDDYKNEKYSAYEMLEKWVNDNKELIENEYKEEIGYIIPTFNNNKKLLDKGNRRDEKICLIEHDKPNGKKEYIVGFNYEVKDNEISWGYGYYYSNKDKAKKDFEKVINGGNLARNERDER